MARLWPSRSSTTVRALRSVIDGTVTAVNHCRLGEIELADDRLDVEADHVVGQNLRQKREDHAEPLKLDGHHGRSTGDRRALGNGEREHPADQEPRGLSIECNQVGLGQDLGETVGAQGFDEQRKVAGVEHTE